MKFLVGLALCCATMFVVADAIPVGAPALACNSLTPSHRGTIEQAGDNPWMIDVSSFRNGSGYYYIPGYTYNGKMETHVPRYIRLMYQCIIVHTHAHTRA